MKSFVTLFYHIHIISADYKIFDVIRTTKIIQVGS